MDDIKRTLGRYMRKETKCKIIEKKGKKFFVKSLGFNAFIYPKIGVFKEFLIDYIKQFKNAKIPLPKIMSSYIDKNNVVFVSEYASGNLIKKLDNEGVESLLGRNKDYLSKIIYILKLAQKGNVYLDPHPKNFIFDKKTKKVFYTDFAPPLTNNYLRFRLKYAKESERGILKEFLDCFSPSKIGYHFMADLLKLDPNSISMMKGLHAALKKQKVVSLPYEASLKKAHSIKEIEEEKERKKVRFSPL